jgi:DNA helicase-2/ATP-dependent DNA helicase PcrA
MQYASDDNPNSLIRWRDITQKTAKSFISLAKNQRFQPAEIFDRMNKFPDNHYRDAGEHGYFDFAEESAFGQPFIWMMTGIYARYQEALNRAGALDFNDIIWQACEILQTVPDAAESYRHRWPVVLEDEAQDSVPLQEILLATLTGPNGNWVRAGDPNQAITSSFTSAHPIHFSQFLSRAEVLNRPLPHSGRSARKIYQAANKLLLWTISDHPVEEVRRSAFFEQYILPVPLGDSQPNPSDEEARIEIRVFGNLEEEELPSISKQAHRYSLDHPSHTIAILVPTNRLGHKVATILDDLDAAYDDLLRGGKRIREIASSIQAFLLVLSSPLSSKHFQQAYNSFLDLALPNSSEEVDSQRFNTLLRSIHKPELFIFAKNEEEFRRSLPSDVATADELHYLHEYAALLKRCLDMRTLPADDLVLALSDQLMSRQNGEDATGKESDLAAAYQVAQMISKWRDLHPEWRLPELAAQLNEVAAGRVPLRLSGSIEYGYRPSPGRITLATQHGAKGMEWDAVYIVGIEGRWIPGDLDAPFIGDEGQWGADPVAEMTAEFLHLMSREEGVFANRTATESAHIELICERLRLLYVGITRARSYLHISRSRKAKPFQNEYELIPATAMQVIYKFINDL